MVWGGVRLAYRIEYTEEKKHINKSSFGVTILLTLIWLFIFLTLVSRFWPQGREVLHILLMQDTTVAVSETYATEYEYRSDFKQTAAVFLRNLFSYETNY